MTRAGRASSRTRPVPAPGTPPAHRFRRPAVLGGVVAVGIAAISFTPTGAKAVSACHWFLDFYGGVFSLVALSLTVMGGLVATDRLLLLIRHRVLLQAIHRATAATAMGFLVVHILMKIIAGHARLLDAAVPFLADHRAGYIGLGTVGAYLMVIAAWTGLSRGRFAELSRPGLWRLLHSSAYAAWPVALLHGLASGRPAPGWVIVSYSICLIAVALALLVRLSVQWGRKRGGAGSSTSSLPRIGAPRVPSPPPAAPAASSGSPRMAPASPSMEPASPRIEPVSPGMDPVSPGLVTTGSLPRVYDPSPSPAMTGDSARVDVRAGLQWAAVSREPLNPGDAVDHSARQSDATTGRDRSAEPPVPAAPPQPRRPAGRPAPSSRQARRRAADTAPPPPRTFESVSDEEFWAFMRGERS